MYSIDTEFFNNIDSEIKAYVLAWFWYRSHARIQAPSKIEALFLIKDAIKYTGKIRNGELYISNPVFRAGLTKAGCVSSKYVQQSFPIISDDLFSHFIRGIFDNYGNMILCKNKYLNINMICEENFIQLLRKYLKYTLYIDTKHYYRYDSGTTLQMMITRTNHAKIFLQWMYQDANYYLTRKYLKYREYLQKSV